MRASKLSLHEMIFALLKNNAERLETFNFSTVEYVFRNM